uniref:BPTI/Kunitz inhibitor domain-containing protein n=1 Tax=Plectus sambesii TaxID=2011161 RepID=A0A914W6P2_9BILA
MKLALTIVGFLFAAVFAGKSPECDEPKKVGPCEALFEKFYYNSASNECETFGYGGCEGNGNNFATEEECEDKCKLSPCEEPKKVGPCKALFEKFYYNSEANECQTFGYGGCQANGNNFETKEECESTCLNDKSD